MAGVRHSQRIRDKNNPCRKRTPLLVRGPATGAWSWALWCLGLELHSPVAGEIRRHINVGCVWLKSFGCDLQLESAKARVRELKESVLVGFRCVCGTRTTWVVLKHYFRLG